MTRIPLRSRTAPSSLPRPARWLAALLILSLALPAQAWGPLGHRLVARLAEDDLTPQARAGIERLLQDDATAGLAGIANWADELRSSDPDLGKRSARWHYVNIGDPDCAFDAARDCPGGDCVVVALETQDGRLNRMSGMVEKPKAGTAPSNLIVSGRYILQPEIFELLATQARGAGNEIQLTDAMFRLMETQGFHALEYDGATYDCGDKIGLLRANVALALKHPQLGAAARAAVEDLL